MSKYKNICGRKINVESNPVEPDQEFELDKETREVKNLIISKYIEKVK